MKNKLKVYYNNIPDELLKQAEEHRETQGYAYNKIEKLLIEFDNIPIGFLSPRLEKGYWRVSAIFIIEPYRNCGLGTKVVQDFFSDKKGKAVISEKNIASQTIFSKSGFIKSDRKIMDGNLECYLWVKNEL